MDPFHERLARVALEVAATYGFALAGGYAVQAQVSWPYAQANITGPGTGPPD